MVSPAAFIALFLFAILAAVMIQGPLGLSAAFTGEESSASLRSTQSPLKSSILPQLLNLLGTSQSHTPQVASQAQVPPNQVGGQMKAVGPNGAATSSWYINEGMSS